MRTNTVKLKLQEGHFQIGTWIHTLGARQLPQVLATCGFDFIVIDMEHSAFSIQTVSELAQAALLAEVTPVVRPSGKAHHLISRPLDNGAMGVHVPHVDTRAQAEAVVRAVKFPPMGSRGSQPPNFPSAFSAVDPRTYMSEANEATLVIAQIESRESLSNLDEILSVPGIDGATLGRGDLAAELGVSDRDHSDVLAGLEAMLAACERHNKIPGLLVQNPEDAKKWIERGIRYVTYSSEVLLMRGAAQAALSDIRGFFG